jgi:FAD/FMN-containing dehydrogenase
VEIRTRHNPLHRRKVDLMPNVSSSALEQFRTRVQGSVYGADDPDYDSARQAWNLSVQQRPALVVAAVNVQDVVEAVRFAREQGLGVAVQATGHGVARPANDALLILTKGLNQVRIDPTAQTARIEAGVKWGKVLEAAQAHGLAPLLGSSPDVGAVGYTLGGGMGWLGRKYGLAVDSALSFDVVTAQGQALTANAQEHADLFWALRGGGGANYAIVTAMEIRLYPVAQIYAGNLLYPATMAREIFQRYREWIKDLPDEMTTSIVIMNFPQFDFVPEPVRGRSFAIVRGCYTGPMNDGKALVDSWRKWRAPALDVFGPIPFSAVETISQDPEGPLPSFNAGAYLADLSDEVIDTILQACLPQGGPPPVVFAEVRHGGGAIARVPRESTAFSHRNQTLNLYVVAMVPTPEAAQAAEQHTVALQAKLGAHLPGSAFTNFNDGPNQVHRVNDLFEADKYARLQAVKATYDPENRLSFGFGVPR